MSIGHKLAYQEIWQTQAGALAMASISRARQGFALLSHNGRQVTLLDHSGAILWSVVSDEVLRSISLAETQEILAVSDSGSAILIDDSGKILWKKRGFPALFGLLSGNGQKLAFVTREPAIVMTDRFLRQRWVYRNLLKTPRVMSISNDGETTAFACMNDLGEGLAAVNSGGKPFSPFMGIDPVQDLSLSANGRTVVAFDQGRAIFCLNCVDSVGIWKGAVANDFLGVSYADDVKQTLLFSKDGLLVILDETGQPIWEHRFPFPLLHACLSYDGQLLSYVSPEGRAGCLESRAGRDLSRLEFIDVDPVAVTADRQQQFRRLWEIELPASGPGDAPSLKSWQNDSGTEYHLLWNGREQLLCLDDRGQEIWNTRFPGLLVSSMSVAPAADLIALTTSRGVLGLTLEGKESFKFFGNFQVVHVFANGAFVLLDTKGGARFYLNSSHFVGALSLPGKIQAFHGNQQMAFLVGLSFISRLTQDGELLFEIPVADNITCHAPGPNTDLLMVGHRDGEVLFLQDDGTERYRQNHANREIRLLSWHSADDVVYSVARDSAEILVMQLRTNQRSRVKLTAPPQLATFHGNGAVFGTAIDELLLIGRQGEVLARRTCADRLLALHGRADHEHCLVLTRGSLSCFTTGAGAGTQASASGHLQFLEF